MDTTSQFIRLFRGRGDVYGHNEGRCVHQPLTRPQWDQHLDGTEPIGVYPAVPTPNGAICAWGCTDIDNGSYEQARLLQATLRSAGIVAWIERSRSKGYHIWVFVSAPVTAEAMRNMQLVAHQVADLEPKEVNPKQTDVSLHKYGNYVRLPYPSGLVSAPDRQVIIDDNQKPIPLPEFLQMAYDDMNDPHDIMRIANMYKPPVKQHIVIDITDPSNDLAEGLRQISPLGYVIWRDGPLEGRDRSRTLVRLAYLCHDSGMSPSACAMVIRDADRRWGKFHMRATVDEELAKIVQRVYG